MHNGFTTRETELVQEFKTRVHDVMRPGEDDFSLLQWLKARGYDVKKAELMYRTSMVYREKMRAGQLLDEYVKPEVLRKYFTGGLCGFDKDGSPIRIELYGLLDMRGLMCSAKKSDLEKSKMFDCEACVRCMNEQTKKLGKRVSGQTVLFDMSDVGTKCLWRPGLQMYLHLVKIIEDNYPEFIKKIFIINAPRIFPLLWKICRPLMSDATRNKISVLGGDYRAALLQHIDVDQMPVFLGGTMTDPDGGPRCTTKIAQGGEVPRSYYLTEGTADDHMTSAVVNRGSKLKLTFTVDTPGTVLRWEFRTDGFDIGFGVLYRGADADDVWVVPVRRTGSNVIVEDDFLMCDKPGTYIIVFDNSFSWTRKKTLHYCAMLYESDDVTNREVDQASSGGSWTQKQQLTDIM